jgi:hypothetical protein
MATTRESSPQTALMMLDAAAQAARGGFACMFSTADEYEAALIAERRAEGRYNTSSNSPGFWPIAMFVGGSLTVAGVALLML